MRFQSTTQVLATRMLKVLQTFTMHLWCAGPCSSPSGSAGPVPAADACWQPAAAAPPGPQALRGAAGVWRQQHACRKLWWGAPHPLPAPGNFIFLWPARLQLRRLPGSFQSTPGAFSHIVIRRYHQRNGKTHAKYCKTSWCHIASGLTQCQASVGKRLATCCSRYHWPVSAKRCWHWQWVAFRYHPVCRR